jgi:hypothetical protein
MTTEIYAVVVTCLFFLQVATQIVYLRARRRKRRTQ